MHGWEPATEYSESTSTGQNLPATHPGRFCPLPFMVGGISDLSSATINGLDIPPQALCVVYTTHMSENEPIVLSGPDQTMAFQYLRVRKGLQLEIRSGMQMSRRGSVMLLAASYCGSKKRTKKGVLADYEKWMRQDPRLAAVLDGTA